MIFLLFWPADEPSREVRPRAGQPPMLSNGLSVVGEGESLPGGLSFFAA